MDDPNSGGDGITKPFSNPNQEVATIVKLAPVMSPEAVYHGNKSLNYKFVEIKLMWRIA